MIFVFTLEYFHLNFMVIINLKMGLFRSTSRRWHLELGNVLNLNAKDLDSTLGYIKLVSEHEYHMKSENFKHKDGDRTQTELPHIVVHASY